MSRRNPIDPDEVVLAACVIAAIVALVCVVTGWGL